jgi:lipopolysaccharide transport system ATP-binding protein
MNPVIEIDSLSKMYRLGVIGTGTISHDLNRWWHKARGKEDPYLKIGESNKSEDTSSSGYVWALQDVNLKVQEGEVLGIIGKNGAGKSTLLKILSKVTGPTTGTIKYQGRIGSLLEVGTGFHPELTGRENIFLNGAILGMTKAEIRRKLDEIIDFAGVARYIDTPVKRYSSGMKVRLGFAVAAHLEPEILVVDEVLAVGDIEFQKKAVGKMQDISKSSGRTILFVSHNMASVKNLCTSGIVLESGTIAFSGTSEESVNYYLNSRKTTPKQLSWNKEDAPGDERIRLLSVGVSDATDSQFYHIDSDIKISYTIENDIVGSTLGTSMKVRNSYEQIVFADSVLFAPDRDSRKGTYTINVEIPPKFLNSDKYTIDITVGENKRYVLLYVEGVIGFEVLFGGNIKPLKRMPGMVYADLKWNTSFEENLNP